MWELKKCINKMEIEMSFTERKQTAKIISNLKKEEKVRLNLGMICLE